MKFLWILFISLVFFVPVIFLFCSCAVNEPYPYKSVPRAHVKQTCRTERNWGLPDDQFIEYIHWKYDGTGYIDIKTQRGMTIDGKRVIKQAVIYYEKTDD